MDMDWEREVYDIVLLAQTKGQSVLATFLEEACEGEPDLRREVENRLGDIEMVITRFRRIGEWDSSQPDAD